MSPFALVAVLATLPVLGSASAHLQEEKTVTRQNQVTATATVTKIDQATRSITLRMQSGAEETFVAGPEVKRFNELKAGDTIKATYYESLVFQLRKPGAPPAQGATIGGGRLKETPGGALGAQVTVTVTVKAVDIAAGSITVVTTDGREVTRKVADKNNLQGVKAGDRIDITYSEAVVVSAEPAKK
jgi:Cu/Ag efflux protein CusF